MNPKHLTIGQHVEVLTNKQVWLPTGVVAEIIEIRVDKVRLKTIVDGHIFSRPFDGIQEIKQPISAQHKSDYNDLVNRFMPYVEHAVLSQEENFCAEKCALIAIDYANKFAERTVQSLKSEQIKKHLSENIDKYLDASKNIASNTKTESTNEKIEENTRKTLFKQRCLNQLCIYNAVRECCNRDVSNECASRKV
jgi:hypothetical protein